MKVAIIGGGASGVLAALRLKSNNSDIDVTIFEKNNKLLKKVSVTGNGRCNLGNTDIKPDYYTNGEIISKMLDAGYKNEYLKFFEEMGLFTVVDNAGRIYPKSNQAVTVVELLMKQLYFKGVNVVLNAEISDIKTLENNKYLINSIVFDAVLVCVGTNAGFSNDDISLVKRLPFEINPYKEALVGFKVKEDIESLFGVKAMAKVSNGNHSSSGEVNFKEDGVSGICVMDLSLFHNNTDNDLYFDFLEDYTMEQLKMIIRRKLNNDPYIHLHNLLFGSVNNKLLGYFNKGYPNVRVDRLEISVLDSYLLQFKAFHLTITGVYERKTAHVLKGGIKLEQLSLFEANDYPNMYLCGEVLDVAGICGGYNLWFAFTSGIMVADKICK